jgi:hypothetical protein
MKIIENEEEKRKNTALFESASSPGFTSTANDQSVERILRHSFSGSKVSRMPKFYRLTSRLCLQVGSGTAVPFPPSLSRSCHARQSVEHREG